MKLRKIIYFFCPPTISYGITVCNEARELDRLLHTLINLISKKDEIIVLQDITIKNQEVCDVLKKYPNIRIIEHKLNGDFSAFKNKLIEYAKKDYLFQIDADEIPQKQLILKLKPFLIENYKNDCFRVPRINTVEGITEEYIKKWNWDINDQGYINFPDYQYRIFKLNQNIKWKNKVHELLYGYNSLKDLPIDNYDYCLLHHKDIERQIAQNYLYDKIS